MNTEEMTAKIKEAMKNEDFVQKLTAAENAEEAKEVFSSQGIDLSLEEVQAIADNLSGTDGEIDEQQLEQVSGGVVVGPSIAIAIAAGLGVLISRIKW